ncbi:uncharacterized protein [Phaseolus vulgaris]|uniref:uncharacterized protein n=1 Tax=Phaseolus vulgaris TaxID=3885 RepID=UPI0035CB3816
MRSLATVKEVQQLTGRMTALSRFLSAGEDKGYLYFQCLKKNHRFTWTHEFEDAFLKLKEYLASPLVLFTDREINLVIVQEQNQTQRPIYFVSKVLQGSEVRYQAIEKAALAMYESRGPIKGQVYVDFVVELSSEATQVDGGDFQFVLSVDGSSNQQGSGADIILKGPNRLLIEHALRFAFKDNNNQADYEALVAGMLLAKELGARRLLIKSDLLLVTGQVIGDY